MASRMTVDQGSRGVLTGLLVFAPLPFGAVLGWTTALLTCMVGLLLAVVCARRLATPRALPAGAPQVALAGCVLALPALLQLLPLPPAVMRDLSPATAAFYDANIVEGSPGWRPLTQAPDLTVAALIWLLTCIAVVLLITLLCERRHVRPLLIALVITGVAQSFYGILEYLSGRNHIFLYEKVHDFDAATGTYINRNHFAGLLVVLLPLALSLLLSRLTERTGMAQPGNWRRRLAGLAETHRHQIVLLALATAVMGAGLGLSFSRAGFTFGLTGLAAVLLFQAMTSRGRRFRRSRSTLVWAVALVFLGLLPLAVRGPGRLATMTDDVPTELTAASGRPAVWAGTVRMATAHPLLGTGLGTFGLAFTRYRPADVQKTYTHAHQDYLQWFAETGVLGLIAGTGALIGLALAARRALRAEQMPADRLTAAGAVAGLLGFGLHGLVDFNAHIPANALMACALAGTIIVLGRVDEEDDKRCEMSLASAR